LTAPMIKKMGVSVNGSFNADTFSVVNKSKLMDYEKALQPRLNSIGLNAQNNSTKNESHLTISDRNGVKADLVVTGDWGGYAAHPAAANADLDDTYYWVVNPFTFLEKSLQLKKMPMPDVTTENGKRIWTAHIDGDALPSWAEMPGRKLGVEHIVDSIIKRYNMPHTISIVEGEINNVRAYADRQPRMYSVVRKMFALPNVEIATHTYSHPYDWQQISSHKGSGRYNLAVGDYQYDPEREIGGSARFINKTLAPAGKKTEVMLWSGNALPDAAALEAATRNGLVNLNGGFTTISKTANSVSRISPMARVIDGYVQAYAPIMNENVYTNDWRGPFDGFRRVVETFEMTDKPRRFKPLSIYYHFYAGTKKASLRSLEEIYDWSIAQDVFPVHASYYAKKVPDFRQAGVSRYLDGSWKLSGLGNVRSLRLLESKAEPVLSTADGVAGFKALHDGMYIHTDGSDSVVFKTQTTKSNAIRLISANGKLQHWKPSGSGIQFRIAGEVPVKMELNSGTRACAIQANGRTIRSTSGKNGSRVFTFTTRDTGNAILNCQA